MVGILFISRWEIQDKCNRLLVKKKDEIVSVASVEETENEDSRINESTAHKLGNSRKGEWRNCITSGIHRAMNVEYWKERGLVHLVERYYIYRESWRTAVYQTGTHGGVRGRG